MIWNVRLDENKNAIMLATNTIHTYDEILYFNPTMIEQMIEMEEEDKRIQRLEDEWNQSDDSSDEYSD
tara:strand:- start:377 stop:580 length:204 start_codon:yes stop_codon:yes gene_type:complete